MARARAGEVRSGVCCPFCSWYLGELWSGVECRQKIIAQHENEREILGKGSTNGYLEGSQRADDALCMP